MERKPNTKITTSEHNELESLMGPYRELLPGEVVDKEHVVDLTDTTHDKKLIPIGIYGKGGNSNEA